MVTLRRTPTLTKEVRRRAEAYYMERGVFPYSRNPVFDGMGLEPSQIIDAIWDDKADQWRLGVAYRRLQQKLEKRDART
jgi:hypothetical protein